MDNKQNDRQNSQDPREYKNSRKQNGAQDLRNNKDPKAEPCKKEQEQQL